MNKITDEQISKFNEHIINWKADEDDTEQIRKIYQKDREDLFNILGLIKENKLLNALKIATELDDIVRMQIPTEIYDILKNELNNTSLDKNADYDENWKKVQDIDIKCIWICPDCKTKADITPDWYEENGTPMCGECSMDMEYFGTFIRKGNVFCFDD